MEAAGAWNNISRCAVRIAVNEGKDLIGSGVLFIRGQESNALIFTAAHVIDTILEEKTEAVKVFFYCQDGEDNSYEIIEKVQPALEEKECIGGAYIHDNYNRDTMENDAAVICIPWQEWMRGLYSFPIAKSVRGEKQQGYGFPASMDGEWGREGENKVAGKQSFEGQVIENVGNKYSVQYQKNIIGNEITRMDVMEGFSGTGLFVEKEQKIALTGIISKECGEECAGGMLWAIDASLFWEIMNRHGIKTNIPESFQFYKEKIARGFADHRCEARDYFCEIADELIADQGLVPKDMLPENLKKSIDVELQCKGDRRSCDSFWEGQLKKAVMLFGLCEKKKEELKDPCIQMPEPFSNEVVQLEFLCTEDSIEKAVSELVKKDYFSDTGTWGDGTIFLFNSENGNEQLRELYSREEFRGIMVHIAEAGRKDYTCSELRKKLSGLFGEKEMGRAQFDIVKGNLSQSNLALIGINRMMEPIEKGKGNEDRMKKEIGELLKDLWKIQED